MAYGKLTSHVTDDVTGTRKVKVVTPICLRPIISKMAVNKLSYNTAPIGNGARVSNGHVTGDVK